MGSSAKLFGGWAQGRGLRVPTGPSASPQPPTFFSKELSDAIEVATISCRESTEHGPRVMVISDALGGAFIFDRADALSRIRKGFPEISTEAAHRGLRHLEGRARAVAAPPLAVSRRNSWVFGWQD